ncbi:hypothetical protein PMAYCL1PPCAC_05635, partial [Pristionchus mayeri]
MSRCCCGALPITTGAKICAVFLVLFSAASIWFAFNQNGTATINFACVGFVLQLICTCMVFVACKKERAALMIPVLVSSILSIVGTIVIIIILVIAFFDLESGQDAIAVYCVCCYCIDVVIFVGIFIVFERCHTYLKDVGKS